MIVSGENHPQLFVLAGPNGSGKTTWLDYNRDEIFQLGLIAHLNPDAIAREISPNDVASVSVAAGREVLQRSSTLLRERKSFGFETTLAGNHALHVMRQARESGYTITLVFLATNHPHINIERVARRKAAGGHGIPESDIRRRYTRSFDNLASAVTYSEYVRLIDNSVNNHPHEFARIDDTVVTIYDPVPECGRTIVKFLMEEATEEISR